MVVRSIQVQAVRPHEPDHPQQQSTEPPTAVQRTRRMPAAQQQRRIPLTTGTAVLLLVLLCSSVLLPSSLTSPALFRPVRGQPPSDTILAGPGVLCGPTQECECAAGYEQMLVTNATALVGNTYNCTKCALGSASTGGGVRCTLCDAGTRSLQGLSCEACGQNTYQPAAGSTACLSCVPNASTSSQTGQRQCSCNNGYQQSLVTSNNVVTLQCTKCATGSITNVNGTCVQCAAGTRSLEGGTCEPCGQNTYQPSPGSTTCIPCAPNASTYSQTGSSRCMCNAGFQESYIAVNNTQTLQCNTCPDGAECISGNGVAKAKAGYWYDSETQGYFACPNNYCCDASTGGAGCAVTDPNRCYPHRHGFLCGDCDVGYSSISGRDCVSCSSPNGPLLVILVILGLLFIGLCLAENPSEDASTKLIVDYIQMCSLILNPNIGINEILALVNLQFGSATAKFNACVLPLPPILGISAGSLIPFALFFLLGLIHLIHWLVAHYGPRGKRLAWTVWYDANRWRYTNCAWEITLFGFMAIVSACVQLLNCQHIGYHYVVSLAPSVECFSDAHFGVAIVALILFCVLTFVVPIWLVSMLSHLTKTTQRRSSVFLHSMRQIKQLKKDYKRQKKAMKKSQRDSIIQQGEELDQKIMDIDEFLQRQLQQTAKVTRTGHEIALWCYHADKYWCEAAFFLRRVIFTLVTVLLIREKAAMIITWFCILILVFHARFPVFRKQSSSYFHDFCQCKQTWEGENAVWRVATRSLILCGLSLSFLCRSRCDRVPIRPESRHLRR
jgi:hypothetical protein